MQGVYAYMMSHQVDPSKAHVEAEHIRQSVQCAEEEEQASLNQQLETTKRLAANAALSSLSPDADDSDDWLPGKKKAKKI